MFSLYRLSVRLLQWSYSVNLLKLFSRVFQQTLVSHYQSREVTCCCQEIKLEQWEQKRFSRTICCFARRAKVVLLLNRYHKSTLYSSGRFSLVALIRASYTADG